MPRRKKKAPEMTDKEIEKKVFPPKVLEELQRIAKERDNDGTNQSSQEDDSR